MKSTTIALLGCFCGMASFCLALRLDPWSTSHAAARNRSGSVLQILLGDGRRLFANHFFLKADAYFHRGIYPGIFDTAARLEETHMVTEGSHDADEHDHDHEHPHEHASEPGPQDWIARINNRLAPMAHVHLEGTEAREMLPWLKLAAELNPEQTLVYTTTAFWLRTNLGRVDEAEDFLRQGLEHNPNHPQLLFELGQLYEQNRRDDARARRIWELALEHGRRRLQTTTDPMERRDGEYLLEQILGRLARVEERHGNLAGALRYLEGLRRFTPRPEIIDQQIGELRARLPQTNAVPRQ